MLKKNMVSSVSAATADRQRRRRHRRRRQAAERQGPDTSRKGFPDQNYCTVLYCTENSFTVEEWTFTAH